MRHSIRTGIAGFLLVGAASCTGVIGARDTGTGGSSSTGTGSSVGSGKGGSTNPGSGGNSSSTGSGGGDSSSDGGTVSPTITCSPGIPATTQFRRILNTQYDNTVRDLLGVTSVTAPEGTGVPSSVLYADFDGAMNSDAWRIYQDVGAAIADQVMASTTLKTNFITCDPSTSGCLQTTIQTFGRKAFRRPLTTAEVSNFMALGTGTPTYTPTQVANTILYAFLVDPSFIYIEETNTTAAPSPAPSGSLLLSSDEVAARLSYMIWGSTPDATLSTAADNNQLQTPAQILAQAQRMVAVSSKTAPQLSAMHDKWVQMENSGQHWWKIDHDPTVFPLYQAGDVATYQAEMDNFFATVAQTGTYSDLFLSNVGFVTSDTAQIYGLSNASTYGTTLTKVQLDSNQRPGFMSRIGFLQSYSHYSNTAPILRGAFIAIYMLGINVPPPPAGAAMTPIPPGTYATNRDATVALVTQSGTTCSGCHTNVIDPFGFALENYSGIGQWQTVDQLGGTIDATATINFGDGTTENVTTPLQLMQGIAASPAGQATYAQYWVSFAYGRDPNPQDQCVANQIATSIGGGSYPIINILSDLTQTSSFNTRVVATP
ncbi:MAG TPA: DUF1592 domain-containing protein [Polyangia bacterium]|nr:DUF1592 domain-containing protein [Polyangia bacterium]